MTKFDKETLATTGFLKERGVKPISFCSAEAVMLGLAVTISLSPAEVVMIVNNTRYNVSRVFTESSSRDNNKDR